MKRLHTPGETTSDSGRIDSVSGPGENTPGEQDIGRNDLLTSKRNVRLCTENCHFLHFLLSVLCTKSYVTLERPVVHKRETHVTHMFVDRPVKRTEFFITENISYDNHYN